MVRALNGEMKVLMSQVCVLCRLTDNLLYLGGHCVDMSWVSRFANLGGSAIDFRTKAFN